LNFSLRKNTYSSIGQVIFTGVTLFLLYRFLIQEVGLKLLGIWSLLLSISTSVGILNSGFTGSIVRYIAEFHSDKNDKAIVNLIRTFFTAIFCLFLLISVLLVFNQNLILQFVHLQDGEKTLFSELFPLALSIFFLSTLSGVFLSALEGVQKLYVKNLILMGTSILTLLLVMVLVPALKMKGLAICYILSNLFTYFAGWYFTRQNLLQPLSLFPFGWDSTTFKKTFSYNVKFQAISFSSILNDPLLRIIMIRYAGLETAGLYELSSKIIMQMRALLITATQSLVPVFASLGKERKQEALHFYKLSYELTFFIGLFSFSMLSIASPLISQIWIGKVDPVFVWMMLILSFGWLANSLATPAYFANTGFGTINSNLVTHIIINLVSLVICFALALFDFGFLLISGWAAALVIGAFYLLATFIKNNQLEVKSLFPRGSKLYLTVLTLGGLISFVVAKWVPGSVLFKSTGLLVFYFLVQISFFYFSGTGIRLFQMVYTVKKRNNQDDVNP